MRMTEKEFEDFCISHPDLIPHTPSKKQTKYKNIKIYEFEDGFLYGDKSVAGHGKVIRIFDSLKEYNRWCELLLMERNKTISHLERQRELIIQEPFLYNQKKVSAIKYKADFVYQVGKDVVVEDVKAFDINKNKYITTKDFNLKWKLLKYKYPQYNFRLF